MPPQRKSKPHSKDQAALARAVKVLIAEDPKMTPSSVADESGLSLNQIYSVTRGEANPTYLNLIKLADGLDVGLGQLMTRVDEQRAKRPRRS
jgi:transcriptional regulator with XRE-family HTH domain